jgi:hypothetical protein
LTPWQAVLFRVSTCPFPSTSSHPACLRKPPTRPRGRSGCTRSSTTASASSPARTAIVCGYKAGRATT